MKPGSRVKVTVEGRLVGTANESVAVVEVSQVDDFNAAIRVRPDQVEVLMPLAQDAELKSVWRNGFGEEVVKIGEDSWVLIRSNPSPTHYPNDKQAMIHSNNTVDASGYQP